MKSGFVREQTKQYFRSLTLDQNSVDRARTKGAKMEMASVLVLIAEDHSEIRSILQSSFEEGGFEILLASTASEAIAALNGDRSKDVQALVTDIHLGANSSGWDVARHARELKPEIPVVYITGAGAQDWPSKGVPNSILIPKPFAPSQVITAVSQLLNVSGPASSS